MLKMLSIAAMLLISRCDAAEDGVTPLAETDTTYCEYDGSKGAWVKSTRCTPKDQVESTFTKFVGTCSNDRNNEIGY